MFKLWSKHNGAVTALTANKLAYDMTSACYAQLPCVLCVGSSNVRGQAQGKRGARFSGNACLVH